MKLPAFALMAAALACLSTPATACWDNADEIIAKLEKLDLTTEQLTAIFTLRKEHEAVVARAHAERLGCRTHEDHLAEFEKASIGILDPKQFVAYEGRERTESEQVCYEIYLVRTQLALVEAELAQLAPAKACDKPCDEGAAKACDKPCDKGAAADATAKTCEKAATCEKGAAKTCDKPCTTPCATPCGSKGDAVVPTSVPASATPSEGAKVEGGCHEKAKVEGGCHEKAKAEGGCHEKAKAEGGCHEKAKVEGGCHDKAKAEGGCSKGAAATPAAPASSTEAPASSTGVPASSTGAPEAAGTKAGGCCSKKREAAKTKVQQ